MEYGIVILVMLINFGISWFNAYSVGNIWIESKAMGGFTRLLAWCGAIMSACGFTWVYLIALVLLGHGAEPTFSGEDYDPENRIFSEDVMNAAVSLGYLILIGPILSSGLVITAHSWINAWKRRTLGSVAGAGWNTFAQVYNTYNAIQAVPRAWDTVNQFFTGSDSPSSSSDNKKTTGPLIVLGLVLLALVGGVLTTTVIIRKTIRNHVRDLQYERFEAQRG